MDISEQKPGRVALGNLSNLNPNLNTLSNIKSTITSFTSFQKNKPYQNTPFTIKNNDKAQSSYFNQADPENCKYSRKSSFLSFGETSSINIDSENPSMGFAYSNAGGLQNQYSSQLIKQKGMLGLNKENEIKDTVNKKRGLEDFQSLDMEKENRFGNSYLINEDVYIEDYCTKKVKDLAESICFREEFQSTFPPTDDEIKPETDGLVNIYEEFAIDISAYDGKVLLLYRVNFL